jgi:hypothetical protein
MSTLQGHHLLSPWPDSIAPNAEAILDAAKATKAPTKGRIAAATLRAAAGLVAQMRPHGGRAWTAEQAAAFDALSKAADHLVAVAAELEAQSND